MSWVRFLRARGELSAQMVAKAIYWQALYKLAVLDMEQTANFMIEMALPWRRLGRPLYLTSANGEVLSRCSTEPSQRATA